MKSILSSILLSISAFATDTEIVAATILGEARGEGLNGMYAVACVIKERSELSGRTPAAECLRRKQFDANKNGPQLHLLKTPEAAYALRLARNLDNLDRSYVGHATHFCNTKVSQPLWAKNPVKVVGRHSFFKLSY